MHYQHEHPENADEYKGLSVSKGISNAPIINPYLKKMRKKPLLSVNDYVSGIVRGDISVLGQAVTLIESSLPAHQAVAQRVIEKCLPLTGRSVRLGITGVPGAGKSTFIEALGMYLVRAGRKLAVLAVDPSSERTKGSILGDKTRMEELSAAANAFIRPSPAAGSLGGVARKTRETIALCEAAGFDTVFVETVGVGQSETAVHSMVDFFLLIQLAGTGDELQGIKRGIMEMADGIVINKADGANLQKSKVAQSLFKNALHLFPEAESHWTTEVLMCSSTEKTGIVEVWNMVERYVDFVGKNRYFDYKRNTQSKYWMYETVNEQLQNSFYNNPKIKELLNKTESEVLSHKISSFAGAQKLLDKYFRSKTL
ncbi:MAG: methylmalonyl Co-A mutase-associated GTPase MeaB [Prevotellaceae bacterium]|jgi:LAO/AO transport system kinase|nr:methylmalonyl Co-A mutase-associated GTPase MeaB [Prevotellaceae bacterium]